MIHNQIFKVLLSRPRGHRNKLLRTMGSIFRIHDLRQQKISENLAFGKDCPLLNGRTENLHILGPANRDFVIGVLCARIDGLHDDEDVLELGTDAFGCEWKSTRLLEDYCYDIVADVSFPEQLLTIVGGEWKHRGNVEHYFAVLILGVHRV